MEPIRILVTGGTFDKEYNELTGELFFHGTHTGEMLRLGRCLVPVEIETLMMIDSLQMTEADRGSILERCRAVSETRIVITHGTDTMAETAAVLGQGLRGKTVVLTGSDGAVHIREFGRAVQSGNGDGICADVGRGSVCGDERAVLSVGLGAKGQGEGDFRIAAWGSQMIVSRNRKIILA